MKKINKTLIVTLLLLFSLLLKKESMSQKVIYLNDSCSVISLLIDYEVAFDAMDTIIHLRDYDPACPDSNVIDLDSTIHRLEFLIYEDESKKYLMFQSIVKPDTTVWINYWRSGKIKRIDKYAFCYNDVVDCEWGSYWKYCENGTLIKQVISRHGNTQIEGKYCNGNRSYSYIVSDDHCLNPIGKKQIWWENGNLRLDANFNENAKPCGNCYYYNKRGKLIRTVTYNCKNWDKTATKKVWWRSQKEFYETWPSSNFFF